MSWPFQAIAEIVFNRILMLPVVIVIIIMFFVGLVGPLFAIEVLKKMENIKVCSALRCVARFCEMLVGM